MLGVPYYAGELASAASQSTYQVPMLGTAVPPGSQLVVFAGAAGATTAVSVSDTQGHAYALTASVTTGEYLQAFTADAVNGLNAAAGDSWTVTFSAANAQNKNVLVAVVPGAGSPDAAAQANGTSAAPSVSVISGSGNEIAVACVQNASAGGNPAFPAFSTLGGLSPIGQQNTFAAYSFVTSQGTVTAAASITSAAWTAVIATFPVTAPVALGPAASPSGGAQLPPYPVLPAPRTWVPADMLTTPRLRADPGNALTLLANPPLTVAGQTVTAQSVPNAAVTLLALDSEVVDTWQAHTIPNRSILPPLAGWYLCEGFMNLADNTAGTVAAAGIQAFSNGTGYQLDGAKVACSTAAAAFPAVAELILVNPATADSIGLYAFQDSGAAKTVTSAWLKTEWVAAPSGTVVTTPAAAAGWTSGATTLGAAVTAGATTVLLTDPSGVVAGGTICLDYGNPAAENVTVSFCTGQTAGISACTYPHPAGAPVSVPVSAAFLNQQVRDKISFLAYKPVARLTSQGVTQSLPSQTFPAGTAVQWANPASSGFRCVDNFSGWASGFTTRYVFPVAGTWYLYGQVYLTDAASPVTVSAGLAVNGGTIQWGDRVQSAGSTSRAVCATVRRTLRVAAGQYVEVYGSQGSGGSLAVKTSGNSLSKFLAIWRGF